jgi:hypothetical protein
MCEWEIVDSSGETVKREWIAGAEYQSEATRSERIDPERIN